MRFRWDAARFFQNKGITGVLGASAKVFLSIRIFVKVGDRILNKPASPIIYRSYKSYRTYRTYETRLGAYSESQASTSTRLRPPRFAS